MVSSVIKFLKNIFRLLVIWFHAYITTAKELIQRFFFFFFQTDLLLAFVLHLSLGHSLSLSLSPFPHAPSCLLIVTSLRPETTSLNDQAILLN